MKKAILVVSFGTSYKETIEKTIKVCESKIKEGLEGYDFFRVFTCNIIIKKLKERDNLHIENLEEVLDRLYKDGYEEIIVQPLYIICGEEFNKLKCQIDNYKNKFEKIILGRPLLTYKEDYEEVIEIMVNQLPKNSNNEAIVLMAHGTAHKSHSTYSTLESMLRDININAYIGTIEGYPNIDEVIEKLKFNNIKKVYLVPFMLTAGKHIIEDMAGNNDKSWKTILKNNGFDVILYLQGLGENYYIQDKFTRHTQDCLNMLSSNI